MNVLVLCTGNRWRSPLLAHLLKQRRPEWEIRSAGTVCSSPGSDVPKSWRNSVPGWYGKHSARRVMPADIHWADVVVGVQPSHEKFVRSIDPSKIIVLHRLVDPCFQPVATWKSLAREIAEASHLIAGEVERVYRLAQVSAEAREGGSD